MCLNKTISIFNLIWSVLPIVDKNWGKNLIETIHPGSDYNKYMRTLKNKSIQEYQFYKLYEKMYDYGVEYFYLLKSAMNCDLSISSEITKGFKYLLNSMHPEVFSPLIKDLLDSNNIEQSMYIVGKIVNNIASRNYKISKDIFEFCLNHRLLEKNEENESDTLFSYNYDTNEYYIGIMSSTASHNKQLTSTYLSKIMSVFRLITENFEEDKHKNDFSYFSKALISSFTKFNIKYQWLIPIEKSGERLLNKWESLEFQSNLWKFLGRDYFDNISIDLEMITQEDIETLISVINEYILPWIRDQIDKCSSKNSVKTAIEILSEFHDKICTLFPTKNLSKLKDFTHFFYQLQGIKEETIEKLFNIEAEIFNLTEIFHYKVINDETLKRNNEIIINIGSIYRRMVCCNIMLIKKFIFNQNVHIFSQLDDKNLRRLQTSFYLEISMIIAKLISQVRGEYNSHDEIFVKCLARVYEYERYYCLIPYVQMHSKLGDNPAFVKFFNENKEFHYKYAEDIFSEIVEFVDKLTQKEEIDANDDDFLVGLILIYDRLITIKYEFSCERTIKIIDLFFLSSKLK